jgi:sigma-54 dependent transcriptional regulator, acetoin dehydrogenase operon transcriptional activator AcoR
MSVADDRTLAHARAVRARGLSLPPDGLPGPVILDSWARCMERGLQAASAMVVPVVPAPELAQRRDKSELVRRLAQAELETLSRQIAGSNFLLAFADCDGVILDLYADNRFSMSGSDAGILAGSCWAEAVAGTNGLGTALATNAAVAVSGPEHFYLQLGDISCTAAPVRDAFGQVVGVLDASSYYESRQRHTQALVQMAAVHIENGLLVQQMNVQQGHLVLAVHPRAEFLGTLSAGLLAFDGEGRLAAMNAPAQGLLTGLGCKRGAPFEQLFSEPMGHALARLHRGGEVRLRDALGSVLVARVLAAPAAPVPRPVATPAVVPAAESPRRPAAPVPRSRFVAEDPAVAEACRLVQAAVRLRAPVLLQGETGTGKELLARHAHETSGRRGAFVALNCAALPAELFEAELFGHAPDAFTGAQRQGSAGLIASADGGTLLLDEIGDLPLPLQAALLRFLDDQQVRAVGSTRSRTVDVQLLAATNVDLQALAHEHRFRADLLYRLNTVAVTLPPLRETADRALAVTTTLHRLRPAATFSAAALDRLCAYPWPGNFRELQSVVTRPLLKRADVPDSQPIEGAEVQAVPPTSAGAPTPGASALQRNAGELVHEAWLRHSRSVSATARALGISRTTVYRHLKVLTPG